MSESALIWLFGLVGAAIVGLYGLFLSHFRATNEGKVELTRMNGILSLITKELENVKSDFNHKFERIEREIGSHESGIRGNIHKLREETRGAIYQLEKRIIEINGDDRNMR